METIELSEQAKRDPYDIPLDQIDMSDSSLYQNNLHLKFFERLRDEAPVHLCKGGPFGPYWSVTRYEDITYVEQHHEIFSNFPSVTAAQPAGDGIADSQPYGHDTRQPASG